METIIVKPKNVEEAKEVLSLLKKMKIKTEVYRNQKELPVSPAKNGKPAPKQGEQAPLFPNSFGMWKDADVTTQSIRHKAWRQPSLKLQRASKKI